jgi:hypothetical protein
MKRQRDTEQQQQFEVLAEASCGNVVSPLVDSNVQHEYQSLQESMKKRFIDFLEHKVSPAHRGRFVVQTVEAWSGMYRISIVFREKVLAGFYKEIEREWPEVRIENDHQHNRDILYLPFKAKKSPFALRHDDYKIVLVFAIILLLLYIQHVNKPYRYTL